MEMLSTDVVPAVAFVVCVVIIYVLAGAALLQLRRHRKWRALPVVHRAAFVLGVIGTLCVAYGFMEPYRVVVSRVEIQTSKFRPGSRPVRIVHISDLHSDPGPRLETRLPELVSAEHPDVIVFTGDSINSLDGLPVFRDCISALGKIAPTFVVKGNVDVGDFTGLDVFQTTPARELDGTAERLDIAGNPIWIAGLSFNNWRALNGTVGAIPANEFSVLLYHSPDLMPNAVAENVDLFCAGHTHGGQVALPLYGALITFSRFGKRYESGLFRESNTWLYVNRGIGMSGGFVPRVRFWSRPEITVIEIRSAAV
jgi:predicted MPP superfamily phosphohydrolase